VSSAPETDPASPTGRKLSEVAEPVELGPASSVGDVVRAAFGAGVARLAAGGDVIALVGDPEAVHRARVAARRLRSNLRTFRSFLEPGWGASLHEELRWLGGALGDVRDVDILLERLRSRTGSLPEEDGEVAVGILAGLEGIRAEARERLLAELASERYERLLADLVGAAGSPRFASDPTRRAKPSTRRLMAKRWRRLRSAVRPLTDSSPDEALHAARIRAKNARYAAEALAPMYGGRAKDFVEAAVALQGALGRHQDAVLTLAWLRDGAGVGGRRAFVAGELAALERVEAARARAEWPDAWRSVSRKRVRFWA
jgi:CHAD domain-containing protein